MLKSKSFNKIYPALFSIALIYFVIVAVLYIVCFVDQNFLYRLIVKYNSAKYLPFTLPESDIKLIVSDLMNYLCGKIPFLETKVHINGVLTSFYSTRSSVHMADVRLIFQNMIIASYFAIAICIFSGFKIITSLENPTLAIKKAYNKVLIIFGIILAIFFLLGVINFDAMFIKFHELIFTNDFWLLDPNEDYIICLLPEEIFMEYALRIVIFTILCLLLLSFCFRILSKIQLHQEAKSHHGNDDQEVAHHQDPSH